MLAHRKDQGVWMANYNYVHVLADTIAYSPNINPLAEEASKPSKRKVDTSDEYLKWKFSKVEGKKGVYSEYKAVPTVNTLVIP